MMRIFDSRSTAQPPYVRVLWWLIALFALIVLLPIFDDVTWERAKTIIIYSIVLTLLSTLGQLLNWGPIIPCAIIGIVAFRLMASPVFHSDEDRLFFYSAPYIGAVIGAILGFVLEYMNWYDSKLEVACKVAQPLDGENEFNSVEPLQM